MFSEKKSSVGGGRGEEEKLGEQSTDARGGAENTLRITPSTRETWESRKFKTNPEMEREPMKFATVRKAPRKGEGFFE